MTSCVVLVRDAFILCYSFYSLCLVCAVNAYVDELYSNLSKNSRHFDDNPVAKRRFGRYYP